MISKEFVTAGRAVFTVEPSPAYIDANAAKGVEVKPWYTYRVNRRDAKGKWPESWYVDLLSGPDNTADYSDLGMLDNRTGQVRMTGRSRFREDSQPVLIVRRVLARLWAGEGAAVEAAGWKVHHEGRCGRCAHPLTVPSSIESGFGPECIGKI